MSAAHGAPASGRLSAHTPVHLGLAFNRDVVELALAKAMNFNIGLVGSSGSGKTTMLSYLIEHMNRRGITVVAIDTQGDQSGGTSGVTLPHIEHTVFKYGDTQAQINPLKVSTNADSGGPYSAIEDAIDTVRLLKPSLGDMQVADLRWLLSGFLQSCGVSFTDHESWSTDIGTWRDFHGYLGDQLKALQTGGGPWYFKQLRRAVAIRRRLDNERTVRLPDDWQRMDVTGLETASGAVFATHESVSQVMRRLSDELLETCVEGDWDALRQRSSNRIAVLDSVVKNMVDSTLFERDTLSIVPGRVNIFDLSSVSQTHMMALIHLILKRAFAAATRSTRTLNPPVPWLMLALDESKLAVQSSKGVLSPLNRIATEGRKYGLGLLLGVQHLGHFNGEIMSSLGTKIVLPVDRDKYAETNRRLRLANGDLDRIEPKSDGLVILNKDPAIPVHLMRGGQ